MTTHEFNEETANQATGFSGFGGHRLADLPTAVSFAPGAEGTSPFESIGIEDAEQLVAIDAVPSAREYLREVLQTGSYDIQQLIDQAREALPEDRRRLVTSPAPKEFGFGVLPPTPEMRAMAEQAQPIFAPDVPVALPASINLIPHMPAIRNQQSRGTCVGFTLTALNEYILRRRGISADLSEQHIYYEAKLVDGAPGGCGTWQLKAMNALAARGQCREPIWPYNPNPPCNNHGTLPPAARPSGLNYRLQTTVVSPRNVAVYKSHLAAQRPVTLSIPVYNSWYQSAETRRSGRITMRIGNEPTEGGHAVLLVGYQDHAASPGGGYFIVRNSWGVGWAYESPYGQGYGTIPYQYITNDAWEALTAMLQGTTGRETDEQASPLGGGSTVTIEVNPNLKITITTS